MKKLSFIPLVLYGLVSPALATEAPMMIASIDSPATLLPKPADLDRHTSKVAEFRIQEINDDISNKIDELLKVKMDKSPIIKH